jgi:hypothetical protein
MRADYYKIEEVKKIIDTYEEMRNSEDKNIRNAGNNLVLDQGKELLLKVRVTDPKLFQLVLYSLYDEESELSVPGAETLSVSFDVTSKQAIKDYLESKIRELEEE